MKVSLLVCFVFGLFFSTCAANLYQACTTCGVESNDWYWWSPNYCGDAGSLQVPPSQYYSYQYNGSASFYFNFCGGLDICNGGLACLVNQGNPDPIIFVYQNSDPYYYSYSNDEIQISYSRYSPSGSYYFNIQATCSSTVFNIYSASFDFDEEDNYYSAYLDIESTSLCNSVMPSTYVSPEVYNNLSGEIYMQGTIPMFSMDSVALASDDTTFTGNFYYSYQYNSVKINGTLSNSNGESDYVQYIYKGNVGNGNPPLIVSQVHLPGSNNAQCVLIPNRFYYDDDEDEGQEANWFSSGKNPYYSLQRNYTSVYFSPGTEFVVNTWVKQISYEPAVTLMERVSDNMPVFVGLPLVPFKADYVYQSFISELNWSALSTKVIPESMFDVPSSWGCEL